MFCDIHTYTSLPLSHSLPLSLSLDIVFFIFLYQRWIYRVDPKRVNEYGTTGEDPQGAPAVEGEIDSQPSSSKPDKKRD